MHPDRTDRGVDQGENALGFTQSIGKKHRGDFAALILAPPAIDLVGDLARIGPAENRKAKGTLGDQGMAPHGFERLAGSVFLPLVVARHDAGIPFSGDLYLCGTEHVPRWVKGYFDATDLKTLSEWDGFDDRTISDPFAQYAFSGNRAQVRPRSGTRVVAVCVGDECPANSPSRINMESALRAVEAFRRLNEKTAWVDRFAQKLIDAETSMDSYSYPST